MEKPGSLNKRILFWAVQKKSEIQAYKKHSQHKKTAQHKEKT